MSGWIKIHREIADHWIFQDAGKFKWWIDMLFLASYEANRVNIGNRIVEVKRGQFLGSLAFLSKRWGVSKERVISFLRLLQSDGMIDKSSDKNITLITICNYESYQDVPDNLPDNLPYYPADNLSDNLPDTTKEGKEVKEIYNSSTAHTCEEEFIRRYMEEGDSGMWSNTAAILHKNIPACKELFERWIIEYQHNGETHRDYTDFKRHFISWSRIAINKESKQQQSNGNNRPDYSRRGRADVPADITLDF